MIVGPLLHWSGVAGAALAVAAFALAARFPSPRARVWRRTGTLTMTVSALLLLAAVVVLEIALIRRDTSIEFVARVTEEALPTYYRFTSLWSAMEGSLLLWLLTLAVVATVLVMRPSATPPLAGAIAAGFVAAFGAVSLAATPFVVGDGGTGPKPSPLLQDHPAMGMHPPLLYAGFAVMLVPYALSLAALAAGDDASRDAERLRRWMVIGWVLLGGGIGLGAWWAYSVLGWGGYWAWDPVENASLLPWLAATAALHCLASRARGAGWRRWAEILVGLPFVLVMLATFLTRSGVVASIHAFSLSPVGIGLGIIALATASAWCALAFARSLRTRSGRQEPTEGPRSLRRPVGWMVLVAGRVTLLLIIAVILVGTLIPTVLGWLTGSEVAIGAPWYMRTLAPLGIALLVLMAAGPVIRGSQPPAPSTAVAAIAGAAVAIVAVLSGGTPALVLTLALAAFVVVTSFRRLARAGARARAIGARLAHVGVALTAVVVVAGGGTSVAEHSVSTAEAVDFGPVDALLVGFERDDRGQSEVAVARLLVSGSGSGPMYEARPELRYYPEHIAVLAGPDIHSEPGHDIYVSLLDVDPVAETAVVRIAVIPLLPWLWWTGSLILVGGVVCLLPIRRRRAAIPPSRWRRPSESRVDPRRREQRVEEVAS